MGIYIVTALGVCVNGKVLG